MRLAATEATYLVSFAPHEPSSAFQSSRCMLPRACDKHVGTKQLRQCTSPAQPGRLLEDVDLDRNPAPFVGRRAGVLSAAVRIHETTGGIRIAETFRDRKVLGSERTMWKPGMVEPEGYSRINAMPYCMPCACLTQRCQVIEESGARRTLYLNPRRASTSSIIPAVHLAIRSHCPVVLGCINGSGL
jgi:hypothetical protein